MTHISRDEPIKDDDADRRIKILIEKLEAVHNDTTPSNTWLAKVFSLETIVSAALTIFVIGGIYTRITETQEENYKKINTNSNHLMILSTRIDRLSESLVRLETVQENNSDKLSDIGSDLKELNRMLFKPRIEASIK